MKQRTCDKLIDGLRVQVPPNSTASPQILSDDAGKAGKENFLKRMKEAAGDSEYLNFNYVGHGIRMANKEWAMILPSMPMKLFQQCASSFYREPEPSGRPNKRLNPCSRGIVAVCDPDQVDPWRRGIQATHEPSATADCSTIENHIVRSSDLQKTFAGKKVFGFVDSCHSGAVDLGPNSMMINAAQAKESASDSASLGNFLTTAFKKNCPMQADSEGTVSYGELAKNFHRQDPDADGLQGVYARGTHAKPVGNGYSIPTRTGAQSAAWTACLRTTLPGSQCEAGASSPAAAGSPGNATTSAGER